MRTEGDWEGWTDFFLDGVATIADEAVASARYLLAVVAEDRARVLVQDTTSVSAARLFELLPNHPILTVAAVMKLVADEQADSDDLLFPGLSPDPFPATISPIVP